MRNLLTVAGTVALIFASAPTPMAAQAQGLDVVAAQLMKPTVLRATFHQERKLRVLTRPLASQGQLLFASGKGVLWEVTAPQAAMLVITPVGVTEFTNGAAQPLPAAENPVFRTLAQVFLTALSGELDSLSESFELAATEAQEGWHMTLTPKSQDLAGLISSVELLGSAFIESIRLSETSGDSTFIRFSDIRTEPASLDDRERAYFGN